MNISLKLRFVLLMTVIMVVAGCRDTDPAVEYDIPGTLVPIGEGLILPAQQAFNASCISLAEEVGMYANGPTEPGLEAVQDQFKSAHQAWKSCEPFDFGEISDLYLHNRISKWPTNPFLIEQSISSTDSLDTAYFDGRGSTSVGLTAMEYLLFELGSSETHTAMTTGPMASRRRAALLGMSENLVSVSEKLLNAWAPSDGNYAYRWARGRGQGLDHPMSQLANALVNMLEEVTRLKIGGPLGKFDMDGPDPESLEAYRSQNSLSLVRSNVVAVQEAFFLPNGGGIGRALDALDAEYEDEKLSVAIASQFKAVLDRLDAIPQALYQSLTDDAVQVDQAYQECKTLLSLFRADLASALSITITVTDVDGD